MPLIIVAGTPCTGKTRFARELYSQLNAKVGVKGVGVELVNAESLKISALQGFKDAASEKTTRGVCFSSFPTYLLFASLPHSLASCLSSAHCLTASLPHCLTASLPRCLTASHPRCLTACLTASLPHCLTASLPHRLMPHRLPHCLTASLPRCLPACLTACLTASLPHCLVTSPASLPHRLTASCLTASPPHCRTASLPHCLPHCLHHCLTASSPQT
jgi:hypothetical protein